MPHSFEYCGCFPGQMIVTSSMPSIPSSPRMSRAVQPDGALSKTSAATLPSFRLNTAAVQWKRMCSGAKTLSVFVLGAALICSLVSRGVSNPVRMRYRRIGGSRCQLRQGQLAEVLVAEPPAHPRFRPGAQAESTPTHHFFFFWTSETQEVDRPMNQKFSVFRQGWGGRNRA
jgi:hypothetical protein